MLAVCIRSYAVCVGRYWLLVKKYSIDICVCFFTMTEIDHGVRQQKQHKTGKRLVESKLCNMYQDVQCTTFLPLSPFHLNVWPIIIAPVSLPRCRLLWLFRWQQNRSGRFGGRCDSGLVFLGGIVLRSLVVKTHPCFTCKST